MPIQSSSGSDQVAAVILAHNNPSQLRRLISAVDPWPVFLHIDIATPAPLHEELTAGLPSRVRLLPRLATGWARPELVLAELSGYRQAIAETDAKHLVMLTGTDYPLASVPAIEQLLAQNQGCSLGEFFRLPKHNWGPFKGYDRFLLARQWPEGTKRRYVPIPRLPPRKLRLSGGSQLKIIAREHAAAVLHAWEDPRLQRFLCTCWIPDETAIPSLLLSPGITGVDPATVLGSQSPWFIEWSGGPHPAWFSLADFDKLAAARNRDGVPALFARKFDDQAGPVLDRIDAELRADQP